jgi:hypothetical protein
MKSFKSFINEAGRCWTGYKPVKGKKAYSPGSCVKEDGGAGAVGAAGPTAVTAGVAGIGAQGPKSNQSEPGVYNDKRKKKSPILLGMVRRKPPKA